MQQPELTFTSPSLFEQNFFREYERLNEHQREAVDALQGPVLVVAGPGTGKTQIISVRICNLLRNRDDQVLPQNILCLTYTDNGAVSMRKRLLSIIGPAAHQVRICTFHAFCNDVIQYNLDYFGKRQLELISDLERVQLLESIIDGLPVDHKLKRLKGEIYFDVPRLTSLFYTMKSENWMPGYIHECVKQYIDELPSTEGFYYKRKYKDKNIGDVKEADVAAETEKMMTLLAAVDLFAVYDERMKKMNRYDYQDMILWVIKAFTESPEMLMPYKEQFRYILVDELQDTNGSQNDILQLLTDDPIDNYPNIFCVGDDDQSIYEFQGARIHNITEFVKRYGTKLTTVMLTDNYRSTQAVLDVAKNVIVNNNDRLINVLGGLDKNIVAAKEERKESTVVPVLLEYPNVAQEEAGIAMQIERLIKEENVKPSSIAILYYKHAQAENLITLFDKKRIPYQVKKNINILGEVLTNQLVNILMYIDAEYKKNSSADDRLFEILHYRFFDIHPHDIAALGKYIYQQKNIGWIEVLRDNAHLSQVKLKDVDSITKAEQCLTRWIGDIANLKLQMLLEKIINESSLLGWILKQPEKIFLMEELNTFFDFVKNESVKRPKMAVRELVQILEQMETHNLSININKTVFKEEGVVFSTCHGAKGSEYRYVFVIGCTKDKWEEARGPQLKYSLPDTLTRSNSENQLEAARRLFYVALTRAEEYLTISYAAATNEGKGLEASRFVTECALEKQVAIVNEEDLLQYQVGLLQEKHPSIALPETDFINERLKDFVMSASGLNSYIKCPLGFYFENIIRVPQAKNEAMAYGSAVHFALEQLFRKMQANDNKFPGKAELVVLFEQGMNKNRDSFTEKQFANRLQLGMQQLPEYYEAYITKWNRIVALETWIGTVEVNGVPLRGKLDKLEFKGNDVNVVDYKTGSYEYGKKKLAAPSDKEPQGGEYWRQMYFYKLLMDANRTKKNWNMVSGEFDFTEKDKAKNRFFVERIDINNEHLQLMKDITREVYDKIMLHEFNKGCGEKDCHWCNFVRDNKLEIAF